MKKQVVVIRGGNTFETRKAYVAYLKRYKLDIQKLKRGDWKDSLNKDLGKTFEVILPRMPNASDARYEEWKIFFNKLRPFLRSGVILIGHSLGGTFLAKYLSQNRFPKK